MEIIRAETEVIAKIKTDKVYRIGLGAEALNLSDEECIKLGEQRYAEIKNLEANPPPPSYSELRQKEYIEQGITEKEMIVALWERVIENRPEASNKLQFIREQIKAKYPKVG